jgi:hypothetical protein
MKYSKGVMWLDDCRIPYSVNDDERIGKGYLWDSKAEPFGEGKTLLNKEGWDVKGRFTPNLLVCDDMLNDGVITQYNKTREDKGNYLGGHRKEYVGTTDNDIVKQIKGQFFSDKGSNSRYYDLDKWFDKVIDEIQ